MQANSSPAANPSSGWSGRFDEPVAEIVKRYTASIPFDYRLAEFDIAGSLAHARMLAACCGVSSIASHTLLKVCSVIVVPPSVP